MTSEWTGIAPLVLGNTLSGTQRNVREVTIVI
jgi:hypothetical protein